MSKQSGHVQSIHSPQRAAGSNGHNGNGYGPRLAVVEARLEKVDTRLAAVENRLAKGETPPPFSISAP